MQTNNLDFDAALAECAASMRSAIRSVRHFDDQDAYQDACINLWRGLAKFDGRSSLKTWSFRIALNAAIMIGRAEKSRFSGFHEEMTPDHVPVCTVTPERIYVARELCDLTFGKMRLCEVAACKRIGDKDRSTSGADKSQRHRARAVFIALAGGKARVKHSGGKRDGAGRPKAKAVAA